MQKLPELNSCRVFRALCPTEEGLVGQAVVHRWCKEEKLGRKLLAPRCWCSLSWTPSGHSSGASKGEGPLPWGKLELASDGNHQPRSLLVQASKPKLCQCSGYCPNWLCSCLKLTGWVEAESYSWRLASLASLDLSATP